MTAAVTAGRPVARLSRRWRIAAAHRLHTEVYDDERNLAIYGKCNNAHGHGHNYTIEVTFAGPIDDVTGMVTNLADVDSFAQAEVIARFDHQNLNLLPEFAGVVPTTENFAGVIEQIFRAYPFAAVERVHIEETRNNAIDLLSEAGQHAPAAARER